MNNLSKERKKIFINTGTNNELASIKKDAMPSQFYYYTVGYHNAARVLIEHTIEKISNKSNEFIKEEELRLCIIPARFLYRHYLELTLKDIYIQFSEDENRIKKQIANTHDLVGIWNLAKPFIEKAVVALDKSRDEFSAIEGYILEFASEDPKSIKYRYPITNNLEPVITRKSGINIRHLKECMDEIESFICRVYSWLEINKLHSEYEKYRSNAEKFHLENNYPLALKNLKKELVWKKNWSDKHPDILIINYAMAQIYFETKKFDKSLQAYHQCVDLYEKVDNEIIDVPFTLDSIYNLIGLVYKIQGKYNCALEYYSKPLENSTVADFDKNDSYTGLARIYYKMNDKYKSETFYKKALSVRINIFGNNHEHTLFLCNEINEKFKNSQIPNSSCPRTQ